MVYNLYTIFDSVADECGPVFQAKNYDVALRYVAEMIMKNHVKLSDYYLCYIGTFDSDAGSILPDEVERYRLSEIFNDSDKLSDDVIVIKEDK